MSFWRYSISVFRDSQLFLPCQSLFLFVFCKALCFYIPVLIPLLLSTPTSSLKPSFFSVCLPSYLAVSIQAVLAYLNIWSKTNKLKHCADTLKNPWTWLDGHSLQHKPCPLLDFASRRRRTFLLCFRAKSRGTALHYCRPWLTQDLDRTKPKPAWVGLQCRGSSSTVARMEEILTCYQHFWSERFALKPELWKTQKLNQFTV